jgi:hypothetical protein
MAAALLALTVAWSQGLGMAGPENTMQTTLVAVGLVIAVVLAFRFPIHIRHDTKIYMGSVPLYLIVALLPPPLAATMVGVAIVTGELMVRPQRGTFLSDIATEAGRWTLIALPAALFAHTHPILPASFHHAARFTGAAFILWLGDILTCPLVIVPVSGEPPLRIIMRAAREAGLPEAAQYMVGVLGAVVSFGQMSALVLIALPTALVYLAFKRVKEMQESTRQLLESMADAVDLRDPYTGGHSRRVAELTASILKEKGWRDQGAKVIIAAARVHDIGKIGIPDHVLKKEGSLTPQERALMEAHAEEGAELLMRYPDFAPAVEIVRHHHERWDGEGYPHRLKGTEIPFGARVIAVADSFDAMTSDRPYRPALSVDRAAAILRDGRGRQWDPSIVDAFLRSIADQLEGAVGPLLRVVPYPGDIDDNPAHEAASS